MVAVARPPVYLVPCADEEGGQAQLGHGDQRQEKKEKGMVVILCSVHRVWKVKRSDDGKVQREARCVVVQIRSPGLGRLCMPA